uniref:Uncharacterized protein n=1 Tax=Romanomermis culicivorax TaxID=13658 RepID=A0A915IJW9_ROMCU
MAGALVSLATVVFETCPRTDGVTRFSSGDTCLEVLPFNEALLKREEGGLRGGRLTKGSTDVCLGFAGQSSEYGTWHLRQH